MRKGNKKGFPKLISILFLFAIILLIFLFFLKAIKNSSYFNIKKIIFSGNIKVLLDNPLYDALGKSLLNINLKRIQRQLEDNYPQLTKIKVLRKFPDTILIEAIQRVPIAKLKLGTKFYFIDKESVVFSLLNNEVNLPVIFGLDSRFDKVNLGESLDSKQLRLAIGLLKELKKNKALSDILIEKIDVSQAIKLSFYILNGKEIIIGDENYIEKLNLLNSLLASLKTELDDIKYIDLRFKDPVIGNR